MGDLFHTNLFFICNLCAYVYVYEINKLHFRIHTRFHGKHFSVFEKNQSFVRDFLTLYTAFDANLEIQEETKGGKLTVVPSTDDDGSSTAQACMPDPTMVYYVNDFRSRGNELATTFKQPIVLLERSEKDERKFVRVSLPRL